MFVIPKRKKNSVIVNNSQNLCFRATVFMELYFDTFATDLFYYIKLLPSRIILLPFLEISLRNIIYLFTDGHHHLL